MRPIKDKRVIGLGILFVILLGGTMTYAAVNEGTVAIDTALRTVNATRGFWVGVNNVINQNREASFTNITASEDLTVTGNGTISGGFLNGYNTTEQMTTPNFEEIYLNSVNITDTLGATPTFTNITLTGPFLNGYNITDIMGYPETEASYIIFTDGTSYHAKNGTTGKIDYSGTNITDVWESVKNSGLTTGRTWQQVVSFIGNFSVGAPINIPSYTYMDLRNAIFTLNTDIGNSDPLMQTDIDAQQVTIFGGVLDGNKDVVTTHATGLLKLRGGTGGDFGDRFNRILYTQIKNPNGLGISADSRRAIYFGVIVYNGGQHGFDVADSDQTFIHCGVKDVTNHGYVIDTPFNQFYKCWAHEAGQRGFMIFTSEGKFNTIDGGFSEWNGQEGLYIDDDAVGNTIINMHFIKNTGPGVYIKSNNNTLYGNRFYDDRGGLATQTWAVYLDANATNNIISLNTIGQNPQSINNTGTGNKIHDNIGFTTENFGVQEVYNTNTTATVTHGLAGAPTTISLTPTWDASAYISGVDAIEFNVTFTDPTATKDLYWEAYYQP
jgi:parallel beta-helix repeat protein